MKKIIFYLIILWSQFLNPSYALIPFNQALDVWKYTRDEYKDISPFWGMVAIHGKLLERIRFFGNFKEKFIGDTHKDEAQDIIAELILKLFPSPDGVQFTANTQSKSLIGSLSRNLVKINSLIEILLEFKNKIKREEDILNDLKRILTELNTEESNDYRINNSKLTSSVQEFAQLFLEAYKVDLKTPLEERLYPKDIVIISLLGFFCKFADNKAEFEKLPLLMNSAFKDNSNNFNKSLYLNSKDPFSQKDLTEWEREAETNPEMAFLMGKGFAIYEKEFASPIEYRGDTFFDKPTRTFPDCGETSLRNIFFGLLSKEGQISIEILEKLTEKINLIEGYDITPPNSSFRKMIQFFKDFPFLEDAAIKGVHNRWVQVVSNLNQPSDKGSLNAIQYGRGGDSKDIFTHIYEIKSYYSRTTHVRGIINIFNVIAKLLPDKVLNEAWNTDEKERYKQVSMVIENSPTLAVENSPRSIKKLLKFRSCN